eukprot:TRINITY_DN2281_c0_g1_i2.p1 TRINITY_DN2281_c0_g1~~TRINITY_DN2281_c0_g1_i2.p1  ORF type:complete len:149 (-),score=11.01 TRINITY_DN2281_c0_g1_i2:409-855(-)
MDQLFNNYARYGFSRKLDFIYDTVSFGLKQIEKVQKFFEQFKQIVSVEAAETVGIHITRVHASTVSLCKFLMASLERFLYLQAPQSGYLLESNEDNGKEWFLSQVLELMLTCAWASLSAAYAFLSTLAKLTPQHQKSWLEYGLVIPKP